MQRGVCSSSKFVAWPQGHQSKLLMSSYHSETLIRKGPWMSFCQLIVSSSLSLLTLKTNFLIEFLIILLKLFLLSFFYARLWGTRYQNRQLYILSSNCVIMTGWLVELMNEYMIWWWINKWSKIFPGVSFLPSFFASHSARHELCILSNSCHIQILWRGGLIVWLS